MLLIDPSRMATSVRPDSAPGPYVLKDFGGQVTRVTGFLARAASPDRVVPLLARELEQVPGIHTLGAASNVLMEAAQAIARGAIQVAQALPRTVTLIYREAEGSAFHDPRAVRFPRESYATDLCERQLADPASRMAVEASLSHPEAAARMPPSDPAGLPSWLARRLMARHLALFPVGEEADRFRIVWIKHRLPTKVEAAAPPPPPPPPPSSAAPASQAAAAGLPPPPDYVSPQAQTLIDAAKNGVPFCEECAKAAAALLGA